MSNRAFIVAATPLATQLSALSGRPVVKKETPLIVVRGKPSRVSVPGAFGNAKRASLKAAVERFNSAQ